MKKELDDYLVEKYPKMFVNRNKPPEITCMYWGLSCGDGWFNIIERLCCNIQDHIDFENEQIEWNIKHNKVIQTALDGNFELFNEFYKESKNLEELKSQILQFPMKEIRSIIPQVVVEQVKEKFATLRFYYQGGDEFISGLVSMACSMSSVTCEECGAFGKLRQCGHLLYTACEKHTKDEDKEEVESIK